MFSLAGAGIFPMMNGVKLGIGNDNFHFVEVSGQSVKPFDKFETQKLHLDYITTLPEVEYFLLGNGELIAVVQFCPAEVNGISFFGLTLWDAERFTRKWSTFLYHPERGFENTKLTLQFGDKFLSPNGKNFKLISLDYSLSIPSIRVVWGEENFEVEEQFFVPEEGKILFRRVNVINKDSKDIPAVIRLNLYPNFGLFDEIFTDEKEKAVIACGWCVLKLSSLEENVKTSGRYGLFVELGILKSGEQKEVTCVYSINGDEKILRSKNFKVLLFDAKEYWDEKTKFETNSEVVNHLFKVSMNNLKSTMAKSGKRDSGIWQYNMEWVRDDSMFLLGLLMCGFRDEARAMLIKLLDRFVGSEGQTVESSRWYGYELTELDQNGELLYALWAYSCWTGDFEIVKRYWEKVKLVAEFPLKDIFWDKESGLLKNKREFWERSDTFGVENGYELAYQFWVSLGLERASELARRIGELEFAKRWADASVKIKNSILNNPRFKLVEDGHFIKRRTVDGKWQRYFIPSNRKGMPPNSPISVEEKPSAEPDTSEVLPIIFGFVDSKSDVALKTLEWVEVLWNQRWDYGGYERYDSSSEPEPPGPWPFASLFMARAYLEAKNYEKVWGVINWLYNINGGESGGWFEYYSESQLTPPLPPVGIVGWTWAEIVSLFVYHMIGFRPEIENLVIKPNLLSGIEFVNFNVKVRDMFVELEIKRGKKISASVDGVEQEVINGGIVLRYKRGEVKIKLEIP